MAKKTVADIDVKGKKVLMISSKLAVYGRLHRHYETAASMDENLRNVHFHHAARRGCSG